MAWYDTYLNDLSAQTGASVESSDLARLQEYQRGIDAGTTTQAQLNEFMDALRVQYIKRGAATAHRSQDSQSGLYADVGGDPQTEPGFVEVRDTSQPLFKSVAASYIPSPRLTRAPALASVITTGGATSGALDTPTVGPTGLAYQDDPINYSTMQQSPVYGYSGAGALESGIYSPIGGSMPLPPPTMAAGADNTMVYLLLAGAALAAYFLFVK